MSEQFQTKAVKWAAGIGFTVIFSLLSFVTMESVRFGRDMSALGQKVDDGKEARVLAQNLNSAEHVKICNSIDTLVSRREFDIRIAELKIELEKLKLQVSEILVRLAVIEEKGKSK